MRNDSDFFRVNKIEGKIFLSFDIDVNNGYDEISCGALKLEAPEFIMPVTFEKGIGVITARYTVPEGYVSVKELSKTLMIEDILKLYGSIYEYFEECTDWYLIPEGFCFDLEQVYIKEDGTKFLFIYIPDGCKQVDNSKIKDIFISVLEKCEETSGGKIQLQLYRHFYKPIFDLDEFKVMIDDYNKELSINEPAIEQNIVEETILDDLSLDDSILENSIMQNIEEEEKKDEIILDSIEDSLVEENFVQDDFVSSDFIKEEVVIDEIVMEPSIEPEENISEDNIDIKEDDIKLSDMGNSAEIDSVLSEVSDISMSNDWVNPYEAKSTQVEQKPKEKKTRSSYSPQPNRSQLSQEEIEEMVKSIYSSQEPEESKVNTEEVIEDKTIGSVTLDDMTINEPEIIIENKASENIKKKNILDSVFNGPKSNKSSDKGPSNNKSAVLKAISTHTRYDLPKLIRVEFTNAKFVIGRATRTGEPTGANYEFGAEITPISRIHAQIEIEGGEYYLRDLGSSNGTFLNGTKIEVDKAYKIEEGDKIALAIAFSKNSIEYMFQG